MKRQLRAFHTKSTACSCEDKAQIETRFGRLKETLLESTIIESHTRFVNFFYGENLKFFELWRRYNNTGQRRHYDYYVQVKLHLLGY